MSVLALVRTQREVPLAELLWSVIVVAAVLVLLALSLRLPHPPQPLGARYPAPAAETIILAPGEVAA